METPRREMSLRLIIFNFSSFSIENFPHKKFMNCYGMGRICCQFRSDQFCGFFWKDFGAIEKKNYTTALNWFMKLLMSFCKAFQVWQLLDCLCHLASTSKGSSLIAGVEREIWIFCWLIISPGFRFFFRSLWSQIMSFPRAFEHR